MPPTASRIQRTKYFLTRGIYSAFNNIYFFFPKRNNMKYHRPKKRPSIFYFILLHLFQCHLGSAVRIWLLPVSSYARTYCIYPHRHISFLRLFPFVFFPNTTIHLSADIFFFFFISFLLRPLTSSPPSRSVTLFSIISVSRTAYALRVYHSKQSSLYISEL